MGIEELNFSSAVLQGSAFSALADLVADLAASKDADTAGDVGLTYIEMQNLVKSFGLQTMASLGRQGRVDASGQFLWTLPLSEVKKIPPKNPVVIGTDIVRDVFAAKDKNLPSGDSHFVAGLAKAYVDISVNKVNNTSLEVVNDISVGLGPDFKFPTGRSLDAIDWFDLSAVVKAQNIRFDNNSAVTDISAIFSLFHEADKHNDILDAGVCSRSGDRLNDGDHAKVQGTAAGRQYTNAIETDLSFADRSRDYLNFLHLFVPTPNFKDVSNCGISTVAPYLEAGLFKSVVGYGLNKEYLTTAADMKVVIRNNVRGTNSNIGANLTPEFQLMKDYGFTKAKVYEAYAGELTYGVDPDTGDAYTTTQATYEATRLDSPKDIQTQFSSVYGSSGGLADQLNEFQQLDTFNDNTGGITLAQLKSASDVKSWVEYINKVKEFVNSDQDHHWSETGIYDPINYRGSIHERWTNFQNVLNVDPRLSGLKDIALSKEQDERLRILLETIANADASAGASPSDTVNVGRDTDLSFSSWSQNDMTLAIHNDLSNLATYIRDGDIYSTLGDDSVIGKNNTQSIWAAAVKHGWSDATEVYGNLLGSGIFMMDSQYNVRSRIRELDSQGIYDILDDSVRNQWGDNKDPYWLRKDQTGRALSGNRFAFEYFTPGHFQDAFFDMGNLQHTANVALRYFDLENTTSVTDDVSRNIANIDNVLSYSLPLKHMDDVADNVVDTTDKYASTEQHARLGWVYNELVRKNSTSTKAALAEITSWRPVPPQLFVDVSDVTGFKTHALLNKEATAAGNFVYNASQAAYDNRNLPHAMVHVMANFFARTNRHSTNDDANLIALLDLHPVETLRAFNKMNSGLDTSSGRFATLSSSSTTSSTLSSGGSSDSMITKILQALVHYGKPASYFNKIGASPKLAIDAYELEVNQWASDIGNSMGIFGEDADVYSMVQHIGYWVPYLSQYTPAQIAEEAANDDDIKNISDQARALMFGLLLAATKGTLSSRKTKDDAARIAGLNAFHAAGIVPAFVDIDFTARGISSSSNLVGTNYEIQ
jgi:hypothetical protein